MIVKNLGRFALPIVGVRVACDECTEKQITQGANRIFEITAWTKRIMLCSRHLDELTQAIREARSDG